MIDCYDSTGCNAECEECANNIEEFPILFGGTRDDAVFQRTCKLTAVPWGFIVGHSIQAWKNHGQSLQRLKERGGLSFSELLAVVEDRDYKYIPKEAAYSKICSMIRSWELSIENV